MANLSVPYVDLSAQQREIEDELFSAARDVFRSGQFILGPHVEAFERAFAAFCGARHCIGVSNGTSALVLALRALRIGPGDDVITVPNAFVATAAAIELAGARPVFVDVRDDFTMEPELLRAAVTSKTRAIIPVHLTGRPAAMEEILGVAGSIPVIEDAAQAVGSRLRERHVGTFGVCGAFSMHPLKTLNACGDAGAIVTDDDALAEALRKARNHGLRDRNTCDTFSLNARIDELQAALLRVKLRKLPAWIERRRFLFQNYRRALEGIVEFPPPERPGEFIAPAATVIQADRRDALQAFLLENGIGSKIDYPVPIHLQPAAQHLGYERGAFPVAERQAGRILSIPQYPEMTDGQQAAVIDAIRTFYAP